MLQHTDLISVAEIAKKPLYRVTCGDIGTKADEVEKAGTRKMTLWWSSTHIVTVSGDGSPTRKDMGMRLECLEAIFHNWMLTARSCST